MTMNTERNKRTEEIINSLDGVQRASAPDFFYTRLKARMEKGLESGYRRSWVLRPAYALATLALVIAINVFVLFKNDNSPNNATAESDSITSIAAEYNLNDNGALYEINQER